MSTPPTPIVLLHGALGAAAQLAPLRDALLRDALLGDARPDAPGGPIRVLEFAGHGRTPPTSDDEHGYRMQRLTAQLADALDRWEAERAVLFGYSMGGYAALHLAATRPERVTAVVTLGTKLAWTPAVAEREASRLDPSAIRAKVPRFADALAARHAGAGGWEAVLARTASLLTALGERPHLTADVLGGISCPVRVLVGDRDATLPVAECVDAVRALPRGELAVLPGTPHPLEQVDPSRLAREIAEIAARATTATPRAGERR